MALKVLIRGGGEMATGVAAALFRAGFQVVITEIESPRAIRRTVAFAEAARQGSISVEGITAVLTSSDRSREVHDRSRVPVVIDPDATLRHEFKPDVLVDGIMSKRNAGRTSALWAPLVIGLGPGFVAPEDCQVVVETQRGHFLGRYYDRGSAANDTGIPAEMGGFSTRRIVRAPVSGRIVPRADIGDLVGEGDTIAEIGDTEVPAPLSGLLRGILAGGLDVTQGEKIGDVDPRGRPEHCRYISDKARQIGSAVLAAILWEKAGQPGPLPEPPRDASS